MSSNAALIGAAITSLYMALASGWNYVEAVKANHEQGQSE